MEIAQYSTDADKNHRKNFRTKLLNFSCTLFIKGPFCDRLTCNDIFRSCEAVDREMDLKLKNGPCPMEHFNTPTVNWGDFEQRGNFGQ